MAAIGGELSVESRPGHGARLELRLPLTATRTPGTSRSMTRILLADDHPIFRDGLKRLLENERDFTVCGEAADGGEAARKVRQLRPDLLLLDLSMPGAGGLDALRELAAEKSITRILLLTAAIEQEELVTALQLGARGVVMKDSPSTLLLKAIRGVAWRRVLGRARPRREPGGGAAPEDDSERGTPADQSRPDGTRAGDRNWRCRRAEQSRAGRTLGITEKTVKTHLTNIFDKLGRVQPRRAGNVRGPQPSAPARLSA
jgi:DNA-binding NarL/FixJ family response regulator